MRKAIVLGATAIVSLALVIPGRAADQPLYPTGATVGGTDYPGWLGNYAVWFQEIPLDVNPFFDSTSPENCAPQPSDVVFVGAIGADCTIGEGTSIAFTPFAFECSTAEGNGETYPQLRRCANEFFADEFGPASLRFRLKVDGEPVPHVRRWTFRSPGEIVDLPDDNLWFAPAGPTKSVTKAIFLILRPFDEGRHRVVIAAHHDLVGHFHLVWTLHIESYP